MVVNYIAIFLSTLVLVFLRGMQQQNVIFGNYIAASITPFFIAACEVASVLLVVDAGWASIPFVGLGGAIGVTMSMFTHKKIMGARKIND